jgi:tRNA A-37 threonylcarbamoyl transferase component Bud32
MAGPDDPAAPFGGAVRGGAAALASGPHPRAQGDAAADARWEAGNLGTSEIGGGAPAEGPPAKVIAVDDDPMIGRVIAERYRIEARLGEGGMGAVYRVEHTHMRKRLALKVLHREMIGQSEIVARFEREAMAAAHIEHPNVAGATDFGKLEDGSAYLVLEYVEGKSLRALIDKGPLPMGQAVHVTSQILSALKRAHELGIVHRDLKPENVLLVDKDGDPDFVKVLDFGIARVPTLGTPKEGDSAGTLTRAGMVYGTPEYMSPEQALGQPVDGRADLYAVGVMLFEMLTGKRPYDNKDKVALLGQHVAGVIPQPRERAPSLGITEPLEQVVLKLLAKSADARFADAQAGIDALAALGIDPSAKAPLLAGAAPGQDGSGAHALVASVDKVRIEVPDVPTLGAPAAPGDAAQRAATWKRAASVGAVLGVLLAVVLLLRKGGGEADGADRARATHAPAPAPSASSNEKAATPTFADVDLKGRAMAALGRVTAGEVTVGIGELEALANDHPTDVAVLRALATGYDKAKRPVDALATIKRMLAAAPESAGDPSLEPIFDDALGNATSVDAAFALLENQMGGEGSKALYDMAYGTRGPNALRLRAQKSLNDPGVMRSMPNAIRAAIDLRSGSGTCAHKRQTLEKYRADLDQRVLVQLKYFQTKTSGCGGFFRNGDCYACLREGKFLDTLVKELDDRLKPAPKP